MGCSYGSSEGIPDARQSTVQHSLSCTLALELRRGDAARHQGRFEMDMFDLVGHSKVHIAFVGAVSGAEGPCLRLSGERMRRYEAGHALDWEGITGEVDASIGRDLLNGGILLRISTCTFNSITAAERDEAIQSWGSPLSGAARSKGEYVPDPRKCYVHHQERDVNPARNFALAVRGLNAIGLSLARGRWVYSIATR